MPVAVDPTPAMVASKGKGGDNLKPHETPLQNTPKKTKRSQKKSRPEVTNVEPVAGSSKFTEEAWSWKSLAESSASRVPPLFTKDGSYFFSAMGSSVKIYSVATGQVVSTLSPLQSEIRPESNLRAADDISCMVLNPHNPFQLITGSMDGLIRIWDFLDAVLLRVFHLDQPICFLAAHEKFKDEVYVTVARPTKKVNSNGNPILHENNSAVLRVALRPSNATVQSQFMKPSDISAIGKTRGAAGLALSPSGTWLVAIAGHKAYVALTSNIKAGFTKFVSPEKLKCLAFHPTEEYFATGDDKGVVRLWYCLGENIPSKSTDTEKKAPTTTLHWHAHAVSSIAFTQNGSYLLSGGEESVLVIWQLHTGKKEFVPRVGAPIAHVSLARPKNGQEEYLLGLADASFVFVRSGTLRISRILSRIKLDPAVSHNRPSSSSSVPLAVHSLTSTLILPSSHPSSLQTYSPSSSKLISELEVSPSNRVSRRDEKMLEPSRVEHAIISGCGKWMATIDSREGDESYRGEVYLKTWNWDKKSGFWILNTRVDRPHGSKRVTGVSFSPDVALGTNLLLATTGEDGNIKLWRIRSTKTKSGGSEEYWVARATFRFRFEIPSHVSWSLDGSLLAVSLGPHVALYDTNSNVLVNTLTCPECIMVSSAHFIGRSSRYLVTVGHQNIVLWDLVTQSVRWHYRSLSLITALVAHPHEENFVLFEQPSSQVSTTPSTVVLTFTPASATPLKIRSLPFHLRKVVSCPSTWTSSSDPSAFALVGITSTWSVVLLGDDVQLPADEGSSARGLKGAPPSGKRSIFQDIFGISAFGDHANVSSTPVPVQKPSWKGKEVERIFDAPAYLIPPLETLFDPLMDTFLSPRPPENVGEEEDNLDIQQADEDMEMEVDEDDEPILVANRLERVVGADEMVAMIELFKDHAIHSPSQSLPNGVPHIPHINGIHKSTNKINGIHPTPATPTSVKMNGSTPKRDKLKTVASTPTEDATPSHPSNSPVVRTGQKRKKSIG